MKFTPFSKNLQRKITLLKKKGQQLKLGPFSFPSNIFLAPMSGITNAPFRLLMQELGAGGCISELVSCHGINHNNKKTRQMLFIDPREKNAGIQLFGEDPESMAHAAHISQEHGASFVDINMGCPVKKVVSKGAGSALLKDPRQLGRFFRTIKRSVAVPVTIKIRTGWDQDSRNADEVIRIAFDEGIEWVAIHGRTRTQQYKGEADWSYLESLVTDSPLPLIGNGDLHTPERVKQKLASTTLNAIMLGRGAVKNPFIFLEALDRENSVSFTPKDYLEILLLFNELLYEQNPVFYNPLLQLKKHTVWAVFGCRNAAEFRQSIFRSKTTQEVLELAKNYFLKLEDEDKTFKSTSTEPFLMGGHG